MLGKLLADRSQAIGITGNLKTLLKKYPDEYSLDEVEDIQEVTQALIRRINEKIRALKSKNAMVCPEPGSPSLPGSFMGCKSD